VGIVLSNFIFKTYLVQQEVWDQPRYVLSIVLVLYATVWTSHVVEVVEESDNSTCIRAIEREVFHQVLVFWPIALLWNEFA
jgi:hypothetical protein